MSYTLEELTKNIKRRIHQLRSTTSASSEAEAGYKFSDQAIEDAVNAGRKAVMIAVRNAHLWGKRKATITTVLNVQDYSLDDQVIKIIDVMYNVESDGDLNASTVRAKFLKDQPHEDSKYDSAFDVPSATNPFYRMTNKGVRLITSTDYTQTANIYVLIEFIRELDDLTAAGNESGLTGTLDELVMLWAMHILTQYTMPELSERVKADFQHQAALLNMEASNGSHAIR